MTERIWVEAVPCTCPHEREDHDIWGCRHRYLSDPACACEGVFGTYHPDPADWPKELRPHD